MLEELYYLYKFYTAKDTDPPIDFGFSGEFNSDFLSALAKSIGTRKRDFGALNLHYNFDFSINVFTDIKTKRIYIIWHSLSNVNNDNPSQHLFDLLEESFGDFVANINYGGQNVSKVRN